MRMASRTPQRQVINVGCGAQASLLQRLLAECGGIATAEAELRQVLAVLAVLAAENDLATLNGVAGGLAPSVLTDVVIANLDHLPQPQDIYPGGVPQNQGAPGGGMEALVGLMQVPLITL